MTARKPPGVSIPDWVEGQIQRAQRAGEFDGLPTGAPLDLRGGDEVSWMVEKLRRENADIRAILPPALALAKEVEELPARLDREHREAAARAVIAELNQRIEQAHRFPVDGPPIRVWTRDVEVELAAWRERQAARVVPAPAPPPVPAPRPTWWRRTTRKD